jgi:molybdopterin adenylyltransferase
VGAVSVEEHRAYAPAALGFGLITVSDTRALDDDVSGMLLREGVVAAGHRVLGTRLVADDVAAIRTAVRQMLELPELDALVLTGGTGFSPRDLTVEAVAPLFDRAVEGFGELFRMLSYQQVGAAAMLSRAAAGLVGGRAVYLLPGSPKAVSLALEALILPETGHLLAQAHRSR